jgi:hypothetical protein
MVNHCKDCGIIMLMPEDQEKGICKRCEGIRGVFAIEK